MDMITILREHAFWLYSSHVNDSQLICVFGNVIFSSSSVCLSSCSSNLHSYARPLPKALSPPGGHCRERQRSRVELLFNCILKNIHIYEVFTAWRLFVWHMMMFHVSTEEQWKRICNVNQIFSVWWWGYGLEFLLATRSLALLSQRWNRRHSYVRTQKQYYKKYQKIIYK